MSARDQRRPLARQDLDLTTDTISFVQRVTRRRAARFRLSTTCSDDLSQDVFLQICRERDRVLGRDEVAMRVWLGGVIRHLVASAVRRDRALREKMAPVRGPSQEDESSEWARRGRDDVDVATSESRENPMVQASTRELRNAVERALETLPPRTRDVLIRRFVRDEPLSVIGKDFNVSTRTVSRTLVAARSSIRPSLARFAR